MGFLSDELKRRGVPELPPVNASDFDATRRELVEILSEHIYGYGPAEKCAVHGEVLRSRPAYGGDKLVEDHKITVETPKGPHDLYAFVTRPACDKPVPLFVIFHFAYKVSGAEYGQVNYSHDGQPPSRFRLPDEEIVDNGCAIAVIINNDVSADNNDFNSGIAEKFGRNDAGECSWGKLGYWAWAGSRVLDHLYNYDWIDKERVCVVGHSRLGKTALWCGAQDTRFTHVISNDSGCSGAAITRGKVGETTEFICGKVFPYWFCEKYKDYIGIEATAKMPFDQHYLLAAMAGRKLYVASGSKDTWADPASEFLGAYAASAAFEALGKKGLIAPDRYPEPGDEFHEGDIWYHNRPGDHAMTRYDWQRYIKFIKA